MNNLSPASFMCINNVPIIMKPGFDILMPRFCINLVGGFYLARFA